MNTVDISAARRFSLEEVQRRGLVERADVTVELLCFEAGQALVAQSYPGTVVYQVLEGEALMRGAGDRARLGKGKLTTLTAGEEHVIENAGGGLLVVLATAVR